MAQQSQRLETTAVLSVPRGLMIAILAVMSWGLAIAAWQAVSTAFSFVLGF